MRKKIIERCAEHDVDVNSLDIAQTTNSMLIDLGIGCYVEEHISGTDILPYLTYYHESIGIILVKEFGFSGDLNDYVDYVCELIDIYKLHNKKMDTFVSSYKENVSKEFDLDFNI